MLSLISPKRSACALALSAALFAAETQAQVLEEGPSFEVTGLGVTIGEFGSVEIDLNQDKIADFVVEVWSADGGGSLGGMTWSNTSEEPGCNRCARRPHQGQQREGK